MCNWRRLTALAGPHILEKCCHDLDLINWFTNSLPTKVAAMAGRTFFVEKNAALLEKYPRSTFFSWNDPHAIASPFAGDTDLDDVLMSIAEFRNGVRVGFTATMSNALPERRMRFNCAEGSMIAELYTMTLRWKAMGADAEQLINFNGDGHAGGDSFIMKELFDTMIHHTPPKCSGSEGLASAVYALALDRAAAEGKVMDLEPIWAELGR
ncbi:hypothetical protein SDC9_122898 [bioreactor metagenome]|uniref:GFO/IDH/MocA-like oxidoreductase domain-containing protein n=1 Tax=bioreactor metagenome TaxID=1076179 RepID=A0A645CG72_9ZZZZ